jgi:hypothetical protein
MENQLSPWPTLFDDFINRIWQIGTIQISQTPITTVPAVNIKETAENSKLTLPHPV